MNIKVLCDLCLKEAEHTATEERVSVRNIIFSPMYVPEKLGLFEPPTPRKEKIKAVCSICYEAMLRLFKENQNKDNLTH